jgi:hypothetical protein
MPGLLDAAIDVASEFLDPGTVTTGRDASENRPMTRRPTAI